MTPLLNILFVEDDTAVRDVVVRMLTESGFRVLAATDGYDAVRLLTENSWLRPGSIRNTKPLPLRNKTGGR
jgi:CheY-like chemotaxis protein